MKESAKAFVNKAADELQKSFESIRESISNGFNSAMQWCGEHLKVFEGLFDTLKGTTLAGAGAVMIKIGSAALATGVPPAMIAGVLACIAGTCCVWFGASDIGEGVVETVNGVSGLELMEYNLARDTLFGGDQIAYESAEMAFMSVGYLSAGVGAGYVPTSSGGQNIAKNARYDNSQGSKGSVKYSPINPCNEISKEVAESFNGATFTKTTLTEEIVMYRVSGGKAGEVGSYVSRTPQRGGLQSQLDLALNPSWGNTTENISIVAVPKGTTIYEGAAAPQNIYDSLGNIIGVLPGGGNQVYIPKVEAGWFR